MTNLSADEVRAQELAAIKQAEPWRHVDEQGLVGLAISGGGIRSATFGLGVLQALKRFGLLPHIHYLSTVSGGGYIGGWLSANCRRVADRRAEPATEATADVKVPPPDWRSPEADWLPSIAHLRRYANYLSPDVGFFSADTWSMFTVWARNALLVQATIVAAVACVLLLPRLLLWPFERWPHVGDWRWTSIVLFVAAVIGIAANQRRLSSRKGIRLMKKEYWPAGLCFSLGAIAVAWTIATLRDFTPFTFEPVDLGAAIPVAMCVVLAGFWLLPVGVRLYAFRYPDATEVNYPQGLVQWFVVLPLLITGYLVGAILWGETVNPASELSKVDSYSGFFFMAARHWPFPLAVVFCSLWLLSYCSIERPKTTWTVVAATLAPFPCVLVLHALLCAIMLLLHGLKEDGLVHAFVWTPPLVLFAFSLTIVVLIGMMGRQSQEGAREWWSRLGAWLLIYGFAWMVVAVAAVYAPWGIWTLYEKSAPWVVSSAGGWVATVLAGLLAGHSASTGGEEKTGRSNRLLQVVAHVAPYLFIVGLLVGVAILLDGIVGHVSGLDWWSLGKNAIAPAFLRVSAMVLLAGAAALALLSYRVDINEFSLNAFYRNRLVRCYLGATRRPAERNPQAFTGFDGDDDLPLAELTSAGPAGPLHIVNCALNLGGSGDLALHTRHSASFTLSPLHAGSAYAAGYEAGRAEPIGFFPTARYGGVRGAPTLGQAIAVSGAAASPNMGHHTSPVVAFLLTVFNLRLGWWFPHPRQRNVDRRRSPLFNLKYMVAELFGGAHHRSSFVMVSDGGHFENLGVYELVRRRCAVIIASDAECDPKLRFEGLGALIRMCEVDFGATIDIDVGSLRPRDGAAWSDNRCAVGTIRYRDGFEGTLIYFKATMTGHEDTSILQYKAGHPQFPHESTGDQFYSDDQFESYRRLGEEAASRALSSVLPARGAQAPDILAMARRLAEACSPTLDHVGRFTEHTQRLVALWEKLRANPDLRGLDRGMVGERWPVDAPDRFRSEFYVCFEMIQLMENVYLDLQFEETWDHPDNQGWQKLFRTWAASQGIRDTWTLTEEMFGLRFRYFCERRLGLSGREEPAP